GRVLGRGQAGDLSEQVLVPGGQLTPAGDDDVQLGELHQADGGLDVGDPEVEAHLEVLLDDGALGAVAGGGAHAHAMLAQAAQPLRPVVPGRGDHAALAGGEHLAGVEREDDEVRVAADQLAVDGRADGTGSVLDHCDPERIAERVDRLNV